MAKAKKDEVVVVEEGGVPAEMAALFGEDAKENLNNVDDAYYRIAISLKGKFLIEGDPIGDPADKGEKFTAIILRDIPVNAYYKTPYDPDNPSLPDCSSFGGLKPDASVEHPVSKTCAACPMNKYNTAVGKDGEPGKGKACANNRRLVLKAPGVDMPALISLAPTSRKALDGYLKRLTASKIPVFAVVTEFSFDASCEYPKVILNQVSFITQDEYQEIREYRQSPEIDAVAKAFSDIEGAAEHAEGEGDKDKF